MPIFLGGHVPRFEGKWVGRYYEIQARTYARWYEGGNKTHAEGIQCHELR